jgi:hypothetical protein
VVWPGIQEFGGFCRKDFFSKFGKKVKKVLDKPIGRVYIGYYQRLKKFPAFFEEKTSQNSRNVMRNGA